MNTYASESGHLTISPEKWRAILDMLGFGAWKRFNFNLNKERVRQHIFYGDTQPAIVMSTLPLIIASYSDEMDAVVMLQFPRAVQERYNLTVGEHMVTMNLYSDLTRKGVAKDIFVGSDFSKQFGNVSPLVGAFLSDDEEILSEHLDNIPSELWEYVEKLAKDYAAAHPGLVRNGMEFALK